MKNLLNKILPGLITAAVLAVAAGFLDMRLAIARLETNTATTNARVERIERTLDAGRVYASLDVSK